MASVFIASALFSSKMVSFLTLKLLTGKPAPSHGRGLSRITVCEEDGRTIVWRSNMLVSSSKGVKRLIDLEWKPTKYCWLLFKCLNPPELFLCKENVSPSAKYVHSKIPGDVYLLLLEYLYLWICAGVPSGPECYSTNEGSGPLHLMFSLSGIQ